MAGTLLTNSVKRLQLLVMIGLVCGWAGAQSVTLTPNPLAFGNQQVGTTSPTMNATLTNGSASVLSFTCPGCGFGLSGSNFNFVGTNCGLSLAPAASCTIQVTFSPNATGLLTGSLIARNDAASSPQTIALTGTGTAPPPPPQAGQGCVGTCNVIGSVTFGGVAGATLTSITVVPASDARPLHVPLTYTALATFSDGSSADVTQQATWFLSQPGLATNVNNLVTCIAGGTVTVTAELVSISGNATLVCQAYQIAPQGNLTAYLNTPYAQQFSELGGVGPYNWSAGGGSLPNGLTFTSGTSGGLLSGTPTQLGNFTFTVSNTDSSSAPFTDSASVTVHVLAQQVEDNTYCDANENVIGLFADGPAQPLQNCNYTAVAGTPSPGATLFVCPTGQTLPNGSADPNCNPSAAPPYYNSVQAAMNAAVCGQTIKIYATRGAGIQNIYNESDVIPPTNCFGDLRGWITVETFAVASLPAPGTRISPAWAGQASIPGRPSYAQPAVSGVYMPMIRCVPNGPNTCQPLTTPVSSAAASGWRFIGIEFTQPHGREGNGGTPQGFPANAVMCPNNFNGTPQCSPGFTSSLLSIGCTGADGNGNNCGVTGASHIILDRIWVHGCDDKTSITCKEQARQGVELQGGRHNSIIDSYINDFKTLINGLGPSVEAHGLSGGNVKNSGDDFATKIVNNFVEGSSVGIFWGGGVSTIGVYSYDIERRRNTIFKPLLWKLDDPTFPLMGGSVYDAWVAVRGATYTNDPGTTCTIAPPTGPNPVQATCTAHVAGGQLLEVTITNPGSGYVGNPKFTFNGGNGLAKAFGLVGIFNIKNCWELKNGRRVLIEGERCMNVFKGQADQDGYSGLMTPKNSFNNCPTCTVQDVTARYNLSQGSTRAMQLGTEAASQCGVGQVSNITSISESGTTVTAVVADVIIDQIILGSTAALAGVPIGGYNGSFIITSINNATKTFTFTDPTSGLATSAGGTASFTPPQCLPGVLARISIHDMLFDGVNPVLWISSKGAFDGFGGGCFALQNANPQAIAIQDVTLNHVGCITTTPTGGGSIALASTLSLGYTCKNTQAVYAGITYKNSYGAGGVKDNGQISNGCYNCSNGNCSGGSTTALNGMAASANLLPIGGGFYTKGQVMAGVVDSGGTCSAVPTSCSFSGGGGSGATCTLRHDQTGTVVTSIAADLVGSGYTTAPAVAFSGGTCSVAPTAHVLLGGNAGIASSKSWCFNNNIFPTAAYTGEVPMTPYPTTQGDPTNNTCSRHAGGGNQSVTNWASLQFTNFPVDGAGNEIPTGDLHLLPGSPGHNAGDDGLDVGPNIDLINQFTGCQISGGLTVCP